MSQYHHLSQEKRYMISELLQVGMSKRKIAEVLAVAHTTVSREIRRNSTSHGYRHRHAQSSYVHRRKASRKASVMTPSLCEQVVSKLDQDWSPEQISGRFRKDKVSQVSCQTIYNWLYQDRQAGGTLYKKLRRKRSYRAHKTKETHLQNRVMIDARPAIVDSRSRIGDWELDCVISCKGDSTIIVTAVERKSRFLIASILPNRNAYHLSRRVCRMMNSYQANPLTITSDNGTEFAGHQNIAKKLNTEFYFAHPYHPWERGTNENTNGLLRQYLPSGTKLKGKLNTLGKAVARINQRPRKCLGYATAEEVFNAR